MNEAFMMSGGSDKMTNMEDSTNIFLSKNNLLFSQNLNFAADFEKYKEHDNDVILNVSIKEDIYVVDPYCVRNEWFPHEVLSDKKF